jgi:hypothetical protein
VPAKDAEVRFLAAISDWLVSLPHDMKMLYEAAADPNLERSSRELAVGAIISTISPGHLPGVAPGDFVNYCDGVIMLRLVLQRVVKRGEDDSKAFRERFREFFDGLESDIALCEAVLGDMFQWLLDKTGALATLEYKSKKIPEYLDDPVASEFLYQEGLEFQTEYEVDEDVLSDRLKKASTVLSALRKRQNADSRG